MEIKTNRYKGHSIYDPGKYRTKEELEEYKSKDPIGVIVKKMKDNNIASDEEIAAIDARINKLVEDAVTFAEESPFPEAEAVLQDVYVDENYPYITD